MKFTCTFLCLSIVCLAGYSQKNSFGIKAGITSNSLSIKVDDENVEGQKTGFYVGGVGHFQLSEHFAVQPNLLVAMKGGALPGVEFTTWNIEVPVNLLYTHAGFFIGAGPNLAYGLDGRAKGENLEPDGEVDIYSKAETDLLFNLFEIGTNVLMGYTFPNGLTLSANYAQGFNNLYKGDDDYKIHSKMVGFAVGYQFGKRK